MKLTSGLKATGKIVQETPQQFFDWISGIFRFDLDVCALPENAKCEKYYTPEDDGLSKPWRGGYGATLHTEETSSTGYGKLQKKYARTTASSSSCCFRQERTQNGFKNMSMAKHICTSSMGGYALEIKNQARLFRVCLQSM